MFKTIKLLLATIIFYYIFVYFNENSFFHKFEAIIPYIYIVSFIVIALCLGTVFYFHKSVNKKNLIFIFSLLTTLFAFNISYAETVDCEGANTSSDRRCGRCVQTVAENGEFSCWPCSIFEKIFDVFDKIVSGIVNNLTSSLISLVTAGYLVWVAYTISMHIITFRDRDIGRFFTKLGGMTIKIMIITGLLALSSGLYGFALNPIISAIGDYSGAIIGGTDISVSGNSSPLSGLKSTLMSMIESLFKVISPGIQLGSTVMCIAMESARDHDPSTFGKFINFFLSAYTGTTILVPSFTLMLFGIAIWVSYVLIMIVFPFFIFDVLFRFCFFAVFFPFVIAFWPFSFLHIYMGRLFRIFIMGAANLMMLAVILRLIATLFEMVFKTERISIIMNLCNSGAYKLIAAEVDTGAHIFDIILASGLLIFITVVSLRMLKAIPTISGILVGAGGAELENWNTSTAVVVAGDGLKNTVVAGMGAVGTLSRDSRRISKFSKSAGSLGRRFTKGGADAIDKGSGFVGNAMMTKGKAMFGIPVVGWVIGGAVVATGAAIKVAGKTAAVAIRAAGAIIEKTSQAVSKAYNATKKFIAKIPLYKGYDYAANKERTTTLGDVGNYIKNSAPVRFLGFLGKKFISKSEDVANKNLLKEKESWFSKKDD